MSDCDLTFNARIDLRANPNKLIVHGSIYIYTDDTQVTIKEAVPQGFNPQILILEVSTTEGSGPKKGICHHINWEKEISENQYSQVTIRIDEEEYTVDVENFQN